MAAADRNDATSTMQQMAGKKGERLLAPTQPLYSISEESWFEPALVGRNTIAHGSAMGTGARRQRPLACDAIQPVDISTD